MAFSKETLIEVFIAETQDHLEVLNNIALNLKNTELNNSSLTEILRELHSIKGSARMMDFLTIETLSNGLEDVYKGILEEHYELNNYIIKLTLITCQYIKKALVQIKETETDEFDISLFKEIFSKVSAGLFFNTDILEELETGSYLLTDTESSYEDLYSGNLENIVSIRINIKRINDLIRSFDDLIIKQFRFKHQLEVFEEKIKNSSGKSLKKIPKQMKEDLFLTENQIFEIQHQILALRMLPLNMVLSPLKKEIETEAFNLSKNIRVDIPQTDFMLDKVILERIKEILIHIVRNSIDHGIESAQERVNLGKSETGTISITTAQIANHIVITVSDDGRGIQYENVRAKAIEKFPEQKAEIENMTEKQLQQYIFLSGFTTKDNVSTLSGRGVGLDIVRSDMDKIKGKIQLNSRENEGTTFKLTIPLSLATQQGLFVHSGGMKFMIPSHYVQEIIDDDSLNLITMQEQVFIVFHNQFIPVYYLSSLLGNANKGDSNRESIFVVIEYLETQMAIIVKSIDQYENVVVNPLPPIMRKMTSLQGVVYDENYSIIPILNIPDIMQRLKDLLAYDMKKYRSKNEKRTYTVLIADDSATTKQIEQAIFESEGYKVLTATDGIEALDILRGTHVDAIISDITMPRMDGKILLNNVRRMEKYRNTPFIVVSGAYDPEIKEDFLKNDEYPGAQAFIVKSEFHRGNLLQAVKELLGEQ
ncbi:MAG: ATP-binding protein [Spirochaetia bacterium]|nr:ATP-binding protein [Spirochaetia bacterium]